MTSEMRWRSFGERLSGYARIELALARGEAMEALRLADRLHAEAIRIAPDAVTPHLWHLRGEALLQLDRLDEAEATLQVALRAIPPVAIHPYVWGIQVALGQVYKSQRHRDQAEAEFAAARKAIEQLAATLTDERLKSKFLTRALAQIPSSASLSPRQVAKRESGGLTARERQVAALIADGKSNREIAQELIVGERTVEGHVGNILSVLGVHSRAQIAAWAAKQGLKTKDIR